MNKSEYAEYVERVERHLTGCEAISTGPCPGCEECGIPEDDEEYFEEPWFSWSPCEICGSHLGGNRESWHCVIDGETVHGTCCEDCNYGRLDDATMAEIERNERGAE